MAKAIFLDRDGVINRELGRYTKSIDELEILPHAITACKNLHKDGYLLLVITNQGGIAKGEYPHENVIEIHSKIKDEIPAISEFYYCPHHDLLETCLCRKPKALMLEKAIYKYNIDVSKSYLIGDSERDISAAEKVGLKGIKIDSNQIWTETIFS